ncbi:hypothetical protein INR49_032446 [Caranx melampygus]|nr:hypothetical protein INR49_032446 [Caranx melampygus]
MISLSLLYLTKWANLYNRPADNNARASSRNSSSSNSNSSSSSNEHSIHNKDASRVRAERRHRKVLVRLTSDET